MSYKLQGTRLSVSLIDFIQKIQRKPRYIRLQILWLAVFICMFFIVSFWFVSFKHSLPVTTKRTEESSQPLTEIRKQIPSLKETFKASIGVFFEKDLAEELEELEEVENQAELDSQREEVGQFEKESEIKPAKLPLAE